MDASQPRPARPRWHAMEAEAVIRQLSSDAVHGLTAQAQAERLQAHGPNALPEQAARPWWRVLLHQLQSALVLLLIAAAALALLLGHHSDAAVIIAVIVANTLIGALQEGRAEHSMAALRQLAELQVSVRRDGSEQRCAARDLVPGDILILVAGDQVGADARLLEQAGLLVAEAALTGESVPVAKHPDAVPADTALAERSNLLFAGTHLAAGRALAVVVATGSDTEVGQIARLTQQAKEPPTPLEARIAQFGRRLVAMAFGLFALVMLLGLWRHIPLAELLMVAVSQMVSMVPEGLPVAMTIALAVGMQRMAARGAIIRRLSAVETLGSTTVICTDKTGTLTRNQMTVTTLWLADGRELHVDGSGYQPVGRIAGASAEDPALQTLLEACALCNDASLQPAPAAAADTQPEADAGWTTVGDPTEIALLVLAVKGGVDLPALRERAPREAELPFDASTRMMATRHRDATRPRHVLIKGAPEVVLQLCGDDAAPARQAAEAMAAQALRVLAVASVDDDALGDGFAGLSGRARLLGLVGQIDPPRPEVAAAVAACHSAGIRTLMVTGDHKLTGLAIARDLGIAGQNDQALDGPELQRLNADQLAAALPSVAVFARVQPEQKLRIVEALQARGEVVAMTGDGVNDAPALSRADVGVAMGIAGTDVAKGAARIVITDDNFASIVAAVEQGRVVYANLRKLILYLMATSIDEVAILMLALLAGYPLPLVAVQILWINIVTEGTLTVTLAMEAAEGREMRRRPTGRGQPLLDGDMLARVALLSSMAVVICFGWFAWRLHGNIAIDQARTELLVLLAACQWFNMLNCRSATASALNARLFRNRWLAGSLLLAILLQALVLYCAPLATLFHTVSLSVGSLLPLLALASVVLWVEEMRKGWQRWRRAGRA